VASKKTKKTSAKKLGGKHLSSVTTLSKKGWPPDPCSTWHFRRVANYNTLLAYD
jgi:hypothetical protein